MAIAYTTFINMELHKKMLLGDESEGDKAEAENLLNKNKQD